jgi:hypothetical protein
MTSILHLVDGQEISETVLVDGTDYPPPDNFGRSRYRLRVPVGRVRWTHQSVLTRGYSSAESFTTRIRGTCLVTGGDGPRYLPCSLPATESYPVERTNLDAVCIATLILSTHPGDQIELRHDIFSRGRCVLQCRLRNPDGALIPCPEPLVEGTVGR